jgi:hypothetical protein
MEEPALNAIYGACSIGVAPVLVCAQGGTLRVLNQVLLDISRALRSLPTMGSRQLPTMSSPHS